MLLLLITFLLGGVITGLVLWMRRNDIMPKWYEWLIGIAGQGLLVFAVQHYFGSQAELYSTAAFLGLLIFGVPALILMAVAWQLVARRQRAG
jgi:biotin transporter BioY